MAMELEMARSKAEMEVAMYGDVRIKQLTIFSQCMEYWCPTSLKDSGKDPLYLSCLLFKKYFLCVRPPIEIVFPSYFQLGNDTLYFLVHLLYSLSSL